MEERTVITIAEIQERARGSLLEITDWDPSKKIWVRVKAVDMTPHLLKLDKMPNMLKNTAHEMFNGKQVDEKKVEELAGSLGMDGVDQMLPLIEGIAKEVLVEPSFDEIQAVYPMTLTQKMELFRFAMGGIEALNSFRK